METTMKIAYLAHNRFPTEKAHGVQISAMCNAFARCGARVTLVVMRYVAQDQDITNVIRTHHHIDQNIGIISAWLPFMIFFGKFGYVAQTILFALRTFFITRVRAANIIYTRDELIAAVWILLGKKVVFEVHTQQGSFLWGFIARKAHIVAISQGLKDAIMLKAPYAHCDVFHDGVNLDEFSIKMTTQEARKENKLPLDKKIIMYTGHLYSRKGVRTLLDAFIQSQDPVISSSILYLVGGTQSDIDRLSKEYAHKSIVFFGHINHKQIPKMIRAADVVVIPNSGKDIISSTYTSPLKLFEYMALGAKIVASRVPAIQEVVDETAVYFMNPDDSRSCEEALRIALTADSSKSMKARQVAQNYSWEARAHGIMQVIH